MPQETCAPHFFSYAYNCSTTCKLAMITLGGSMICKLFCLVINSAEMNSFKGDYIILRSHLAFAIHKPVKFGLHLF